MKVYELMNKLSQIPSGKEIKISMIKTLDELPVFDGDEDSRSIDFILQSVENEDDYVILDGWTV